MKPDASEFKNQLERLLSIGKKNSVPIVFVSQVTAIPFDERIGQIDWQKERVLKKEVARVIKTSKADYPMLNKVRMYKTQLLQEVIHSLAGEYEVVWVDIREKLGKDKHYFCDEIHLTDAGNAAIAEQVADAEDFLRLLHQVQDQKLKVLGR